MHARRHVVSRAFRNVKRDQPRKGIEYKQARLYTAITEAVLNLAANSDVLEMMRQVSMHQNGYLMLIGLINRDHYIPATSATIPEPSHGKTVLLPHLRASKALASLRSSADWPEPSLLSYTACKNI